MAERSGSNRGREDVAILAALTRTISLRWPLTEPGILPHNPGTVTTRSGSLDQEFASNWDSRGSG